MKKKYLIILVLIVLLLWWCNYLQSNKSKIKNNQLWVNVIKKDVNINWSWSNINQKENSEKINSIQMWSWSNINQKRNNKQINLIQTWSWSNDDYLHLFHFEKLSKHLLFEWAYLLKDSMILNKKMLKSLEQFKNLWSWLTKIEKNALEKTLQNYQKNLELQKELMRSWNNKQKCIKNIYSKPKIQQKTDIILPKTKLKSKNKIIQQKQIKTKPKQNITNTNKNISKSKQNIIQQKQTNQKKWK